MSSTRRLSIIIWRSKRRTTPCASTKLCLSTAMRSWNCRKLTLLRLTIKGHSLEPFLPNLSKKRVVSSQKYLAVMKVTRRWTKSTKKWLDVRNLSLLNQKIPIPTLITIASSSHRSASLLDWYRETRSRSSMQSWASHAPIDSSLRRQRRNA